MEQLQMIENKIKILEDEFLKPLEQEKKRLITTLIQDVRKKYPIIYSIMVSHPYKYIYYYVLSKKEAEECMLDVSRIYNLCSRMETPENEISDDIILEFVRGQYMVIRTFQKNEFKSNNTLLINGI